MLGSIDWLKFAELLAIGLAFGSNVWNIISGLIAMRMKAQMGEQNFGNLRSAEFHRFFQLQAACFLAVLGLTGGKSVACAAGLLASVVQLLVLVPMTDRTMRAKWEMEKQAKGDLGHPGFKAAKRRFGMVHGISMLVNMVGLVACVAQFGLHSVRK